VTLDREDDASQLAIEFEGHVPSDSIATTPTRSRWAGYRRQR
jgi:hypothetical protein